MRSGSAMRERISFVVPTFPRTPSGGARTFYAHANGLAERGYEVSVIHSLALRSGAPMVVDLARSKVRDVRAGLLRKRVRWTEVDPRVRMLFIRRMDNSVVLPPADLRIGTYWLTNEFLDSYPADGARHMQLIQAYETWAGPADRVDATWKLPIHTAVVSNSLLRRAVEMGVPSDRLHVVPNGLDHEVFRPVQSVAARPPVIGFLAHEAPVKGLDVAVAAVRALHRLRPDVPVVAFGGARRPPQLPEFVRYLRGLTGSELANQLYNRISIFLCSSISEGFGFPSIEAMACGAALVSTRNGGVDDFAREAESALLCDIDDHNALAKAMLSLIENDRLRLRIAANGIAMVQRFSWEASIEAMERAVRTALDGDTAGSR